MSNLLRLKPKTALFIKEFYQNKHEEMFIIFYLEKINGQYFDKEIIVPPQDAYKLSETKSISLKPDWLLKCIQQGFKISMNGSLWSTKTSMAMSIRPNGALT